METYWNLIRRALAPFTDRQILLGEEAQPTAPHDPVYAEPKSPKSEVFPSPRQCTDGQVISPCETNFRCVGLNDVMKTQFQTVFSQAKLEALVSGLSDSTRVSYQSSWMAWGRFCFVRNISVWLLPGEPGWGEPLLDFLIWTSKVLGEISSTLKTRFSAIRFMHLINGNIDFSPQAHRAKAMMRGLKKREGVQRKYPFNTDLLRWMQTELVTKGDERSG